MKCNRTACQTELVKHGMLIWNLGTDQPRVYCLKCGKKIIEYNPTLVWGVDLVSDIEFQYPNLAVR